MKKVLILTSHKFVGSSVTQLDESEFETRLNEQLTGQVDVKIVAFDELVFQAGKTVKIWHGEEGFDIADFDAVIIRKVGRYLELGIAAAHYLRNKKVTFSDSYLLTSGNGKLACAFIRSIKGLPVPDTIVGPTDALLKNDLITFPVVVKADLGHAGQDNFLVSNKDEYQRVMHEYPTKIMVTQPFIPNDGDLRILVLEDKPALAILRQSPKNSHLNNTSQGGKASIIDINDVRPAILEDALKASALENLEVAGVDVIINKETGEHAIIEVNRAPQIPTGTYLDEKIVAYAEFIKNLAHTKQIFGNKHPMIGRAERIRLPELLDNPVKARIDTGARTSSIWAHAVKQEDGRLAVNFLSSRPNQTDTIYFDEFDETIVASSTGHEQHRYKVRLLVQLGRKKIRAWFTLADRSTQVYPVLIGRNVLMKKFTVDVSKGKPDRSKERIRSTKLQSKKGEKL